MSEKRRKIWRFCDCGVHHKIEPWRAGTTSDWLCMKCLDKEHIRFIRKFPWLAHPDEKHLLEN